VHCAAHLWLGALQINSIYDVNPAIAVAIAIWEKIAMVTMLVCHSLRQTQSNATKVLRWLTTNLSKIKLPQQLVCF
jgi:hypothetical protein